MEFAVAYCVKTSIFSSLKIYPDMSTTSNPQPENPQAGSAASADSQPTGETLSRVAEEGGIEPSHKPEDPEAERDEMRRDADAGVGS